MRVVQIVPVLSLVSLISACNPAPVTPDAATSPDASMADVAMGPTADAGNDAGATGCSDLTGGWILAGTCSVAGFSPFPAATITQSECMADITVTSGTIRGSVVGNTLTFSTSVSSFPLECTATLMGTSLRVNCSAAGGAATCEATGTRANVPGATRYGCDVFAQDCGAGQRCTPYAAGTSPGSNILNACVPAGALALDATCMREGGRLGADQCGAGLFCANFGQVSLDTRVCRPLCTQASHCGAGQVCVALTNAPRAGVCTPSCTLGGADCGAGTTCRSRTLWDAAPTGAEDVTSFGTSCEPLGAAAAGAPCMVNADCGASLECSRRSGAEAFACRPSCSTSVACPSGFTCSAYSGGMNPGGNGACYAM